MALQNGIHLIGRFTKDPEQKSTQSGFPVCSFSIAVDRPHTTKENRVADFFDCTAWRQTAELVAKYFHKGDPVGIEGYMHQETYTNKDGQTVKTWKVEVENVTFMPTRKSDVPEATAQAPTQTEQPAVNMTPIAPEEDLPF